MGQIKLDRVAESILSKTNIDDDVRVIHISIGKLAFAEFEKSRKRLGDLSANQEEAIRVMLNSIVNKFMQLLVRQRREFKNANPHNTMKLKVNG